VRAKSPKDPDRAERVRLPVAKVLGYLVALGLLAASLWYALRGQRPEDWQVLLSADPGLLVGLVAAVIVSTLLLPGLQFWLVTAPFVTTRPLGFWVITGISAGSQLLNYTPLKAGLIRRIGYLRLFHGVGYRAALISNALLLALVAAACVITLLLTLWLPDFGIVWLTLCGFALLLVAMILLPLLRATVPADVPIKGALSGTWLQGVTYLLLCLAVQVMIQLFVALRWWIVFRILGHSVNLATAWLLAILHLVTELIGPANGLGLREWLVGLASGLELDGVSPAFELTEGLAASLLDRAVEAAVVIVAGTVSLLILRRIAAGVMADKHTELL
jgi:hypothetical protein